MYRKHASVTYLIAALLCTACGDSGLRRKLNIADSAIVPTVTGDTLSLQPHIKVYDTTHYYQPNEDFDGVVDEDGIAQKQLQLPQYRLWKKRRHEIGKWNAAYAFLHLPDSANIVDEQLFRSRHGSRVIVAWMTNMNVEIDPERDYISCPEVATGKGFFYGKLHFSLVDTRHRKMINSIEIYQEDSFVQKDTVFYDEENQYMNYPFSIGDPRKRQEIGEFTYPADGGTDSTDGEARPMRFKDFNNDGKAFEFGLYVQLGCALKISTLIGYNEHKDSLIWYTWNLDVKYDTADKQDTDKRTHSHWPDRAVTFQFDTGGRLNFMMDYRGLGGDLIRYYLRYNRILDNYTGVEDHRSMPDDSARKCSWYPEPEKVK